MTTPPEQFPSQISPDRFRSALAQLAASLVVVSVRGESGDPKGFTASSVMSASLDPPLLVVGVDLSSSCHADMAASREFAVNVLGDHQRQDALVFATSGIDRFARTGHNNWPGSDLPLLPDARLVYRCLTRRVVRVGDHDLLVGELSDVRGTGAGEPLVWHRGDFLPRRIDTEPQVGQRPSGRGVPLWRL